MLYSEQTGKKKVIDNDTAGFFNTLTKGIVQQKQFRVYIIYLQMFYVFYFTFFSL